MSANTDLIYNVKRKMLAKYPRFGSEIAVANIEFKDNLKYHTAATDGKNIYVDPNYFASLSENDRLFTIAHEIMHIKFMHMFRLKDKSGVKRDPELWNIATDAIINANLERDGFTIKEGYVNMPEALDYSAEEFYQKLLQEKEKKEQEQEDEQNSNNENSEQTENQESDNNKSQGDDHSLWEETFKEQQNSGKKGQRQDKNTQKQAQKQTQEQDQEQEEEQIDTDFDERGEFEDNRKEKREKFKSRREKTEKDIRNTDKGTIELGDIGKSKEEIDAWRRNTIDAMPPDSLGEVEELSVKLAHAEVKLEGRKSERDVSLAELAAQAEEARTHQSKSNHSEQAVDWGIENWQSCCLKGI